MFMFEDSPQVTISRFLVKSDIWPVREESFVSGNTNFIKAISKYSGSHVACFDLVPDNSVTVKRYNKLVEFVMNERTDVLVLPIPCVEYLILDTLVKCGVIPKNGVVADLLMARPYCESIVAKSYEKYCKRVLDSNEVRQCVRVFRGKSGQYYEDNCLCDIFTEGCDAITVKDKSRRVMSNLVLGLYGNNGVSSKDLLNSCKTFYRDLWCKLSEHRTVKYGYDKLLWCM